MSRSVSMRAAALACAVMCAAAIGLTACAPEPTPADSSSPEPSASPAPEPYSGPLVFVGDELGQLLPTSAEIAEMLPGAADIGEPSSTLEQISDGGGPEPVPSICAALFAEQSLWSVGARTLSWKTSDGSTGSAAVLAFADEAQAQTRMDQLLDAAGQCATFDYNGSASFDSAVPAPSEHARSLAGTLGVDGVEGTWRRFLAFASIGNVVVQLWQPVGGEGSPDAKAVATTLQDRADLAGESLVEDLTANPPTSEEESDIDASAPWNEWKITPDGVGPMLLGDTVDVTIAAVTGANVRDPEYDGGPWTLANAQGTASMLVTAQEQDGTSAASITVGNARTLDDIPQDGAQLPARDEVRVGDAVADAVSSFPGGTAVSVVSSGDEWYDVSTRDGMLFRFHTDRAVSDASAVVVGITVEDATMRRDLDFG